MRKTRAEHRTIFERFPTQEACIAHLPLGRYPPLPLRTNTARTPKRPRCYACKTSFMTVGTIFHHTHMPLQKWFLAISLMLYAKKGLSALHGYQVNKNTAWRIAMQIRKAMTQIEQRC